MGNLEELVEKIKAAGAKRVFVQLPEGLLTGSRELEEKLEGIETFISLEPCYGSCDLRDCEALRLGCDLIVNVGHSDFGLRSRVPVLYYEWRVDWDPVPVLEKILDNLPEKICLVSTVNFLDTLEKAGKFLESHGKKCYTETGSKTKHPGQILGCDVSAALKLEKKVDAFLFLGSGVFHPLGMALRTSKPVFSLNADKNSLEQVDAEKFLRQREVAKGLAGDCKTFGILVSTKPGQLHAEEALRIKKKLESQGRKAFIFTMDCITPEKLEGLGMDCYVNCACPRIAIENRTSFRKPILNPEEIF